MVDGHRARLVDRGQATMNTTVQLKLKRLQALRSDESGVITSLRNLTEFHEPHLVPQEDRRTLRGAVEQRSIAINHAFLAAFDGLSEVRANNGRRPLGIVTHVPGARCARCACARALG